MKWEDDHEHPREATRKAKSYDGISKSVVQANVDGESKRPLIDTDRVENEKFFRVVTTQGRVLYLLPRTRLLCDPKFQKTRSVGIDAE